LTTFSEAYLRAIGSMEGQPPSALQPTVDFFARDIPGLNVSLAALRSHLEDADPDDVLRTRLHLLIATWDASAETEPWTDDTASHSVERRVRTYELLALDKAATDAFDATYPRTGSGAVVISEEFEPWYDDERRAQRDFYWRAYRRQLINTGSLDSDAIPKLDHATSLIVERLSDPIRPQAYQAKGLVVGYVQSGKTANFIGVIAKAIDAGYRLIIVLTGTLDLLRQQTQRRLDMELVGIENIFLGVDPEDPDQARDIDYFLDPDRAKGRFLKHGFQPSEREFPDIVRLTTHASDYKSLKAGITALELSKSDKQKALFDPVNLFSTDARLAIVKKNTTVLKRLVRDLKAIRTHLGEIPTLIIDDESDQASVNTRDPAKWQQGQVDRTATNRLLSELLGLLPRAQYVGYTATPYANVFIDPGDTEDIFPKDFLLSLERPAGYMGVSDFHDLDSGIEPEARTVANSNEKAHVRGLYGTGLDAEQELLGALDAFVLAGAIKLYRAAVTEGKVSFRHHTMLVHESVKISEHRDLADMVKRLWGGAGYVAASGQARLSALFETDFRPVHDARAPEVPFPATFDDLNPYVGKAVTKILEDAQNPVLVVNGDRDVAQQNLDFDKRDIWRILVGGTKLSRGFTVEGLTVSYYRRRTRQADTLMQMGRWFGFRRNYHDLVRLYIGRAEPGRSRVIDLYEAFEAIVRDEEAFRDQLRAYSQMVEGRPQITPKDIPPLVSQHLPWITPSARNKMFNAELVLRRSPGAALEPTGYPEDAKAIAANFATLAPLLAAADDPRLLKVPNEGNLGGGTFNALVGTVAASDVLSALEKLSWIRKAYFAPDLAYIAEITANGQVDDWVVIAPQVEGTPVDLPGVGPRTLLERQRRAGRGGLYGAVSDPKHRPPILRIANGRDTYGDAEAETYVGERRGAILLYPVVDRDTKRSGIVDTTTGDIVVALVIAAPRSAAPSNGQVVQFRARDSRAPQAPIVEIPPD